MITQRIQHFLRQRESVLRRDLLIALVPPLASAILLGYTITEVQRAKLQVSTLETVIEQREYQLADAQDQLRKTMIQKRYIRDIGGRDVLALKKHSPREAELLSKILELRSGGVSWASQEANPELGFDSPSFVGHILREMNLTMGYLKLGDSPQSSSKILFENLRYVEKPKLGDLVFYPAGYVFFYFHDSRGRPFVIGMTPLGVHALDPLFAEPKGFRNFWFAGSLDQSRDVNSSDTQG